MQKELAVRIQVNGIKLPKATYEQIWPKKDIKDGSALANQSNGHFSCFQNKEKLLLPQGKCAERIYFQEIRPYVRQMGAVGS